MAEERVQRRLAAILAADVAGYSRMMGEDEEGTLAALTAHRAELIDPCIAEHQGRIVKTTGDGLIVEFASVVDAVQCAVAVQDGMAERNAGAPEDRRIRFRIGINLGDVIVQDEDIFGDGVNVAARLEGLAEPDGIVVSAIVHEAVGSKLDLAFEDLGDQEVKNIAKPVRAYRVSEMGAAPDVSHPLALPDRPSIAILPFVNMSGDAEQDYFVDGMTEDLITDLSKISGLFVIARNSSFAYKGKQVDLRSVGRELGVRHILEGSVRKAGSRVRINAQLIDATDGGHLWAERYDGEIEDIFSLQDEIGQRIVAALEVHLSEQEIARRETGHVPNLEAYDQFVRGRQIVNERYFQQSHVTRIGPTPEVLQAARNHFEQATALDSRFAGGYAGMSWSYSLGVRHRLSEHPEADKEEAFRLAQLAVETDDTFGWAYTALASIHLMYGRYDEANTAIDQAVNLQPSDGDALAYQGFHRFWAGRHEEALRPLEEALRIDPRFLGRTYSFLGFAKFGLERYEEALSDIEAAMSLGHVIHYTFALSAATCWYLGKEREAGAMIERFRDMYPDLTIEDLDKMFPYANRDDTLRVTAALVEAGYPE